MRILITQDTDWIKRFPGQQHHLAERLSLRGHEIRVIDYEILWRLEHQKELYSKRRIFTNVTKILDCSGVTVIRPSILKIPLLDYGSMFFTYSRDIDAQIREFRPHIIVGHSILTNYISMRLSKSFGIPFIFHMTDAQHTIIPYKYLKPFGKLIERRVLNNADAVIVINEVLKEYAINLGANPAKTRVVKAGTDIERYNPGISGDRVRAKYHIDKNDHVIFFMGWLYDFSGLKEVAIELSKVKETRPNIKFMIVGDGDAFDDLQRIKEEFCFDNQIILTGKQPFEEIPELIAAADVCILPAYNNEIMRNIVPIKLYEYMAMKKPVITTMLPGVMKEFGKDNGVIYVDKPEDALKKAIELIDDGRSLEYGTKARKFVEKNSWEKVVDEFESILTELVQSKQTYTFA